MWGELGEGGVKLSLPRAMGISLEVFVCHMTATTNTHVWIRANLYFGKDYVMANSTARLKL